MSRSSLTWRFDSDEALRETTCNNRLESFRARWHAFYGSPLYTRTSSLIMNAKYATIIQARRAVTEPKWSSNTVRRQSSLRGRTSGLQAAADPVSRSSRIQRVFVGVTDQHRPKFKARFLLHGNSPIHSLLTLQSRRPSDVLSSPDPLHQMLHIRSQNRGKSRNGLTDRPPMSRSLPYQIAYQLRISPLNGKQRI
jgi:hypothetical protein